MLDLSMLRYRVMFCLLAGLCGAALHATKLYSVTVDTSSVNGTQGFLDFQFNPGNNSSQSATVQILNFNPGGGVLTGFPEVTGDVTGTLPGTLTFSNSTPLNDYFQGFTYGSMFSFDLFLSGPAVDSPNGVASAGSSFGAGLFDSNQNPILTNAPSGLVQEVDINLDGTITATGFPTDTGGPSVVSFTVTAVPEPTTAPLMAALLAGIALVRRRKR